MKGFRNRILVPLAIPMAATAVVVAVVFNFSRILLALEERRSATVATVVAIIAAAAVLFGSAYFSSRREARTAGLSALATASIVLVFAGGYGLGATGVEGEGGGSEGAGEAAAGGGEVAAGGGEVNIVAKDPFTYEPKEFSVPAGKVKVTLTNQGVIVHTFLFEKVPTFEKLVASGTKRQAPGKGPTATGTADLKPGTYVFFCDERGHRGAGMEGKLTVTEGGGPASTAAAGGGAADIVAKDPFTYEPKELSVPAGKVKVTLTNQGVIVHTLLFETVPSFEKMVASGTKRQAPGKGPTATASVDLKPGTYVFFCDERGHRGAGMEGKLTVTEGGGAAAASTAAAGGGAADIVAKDPFTYEPKELSVPAGKVKITLTNQGVIVHTLLFEKVPSFEKMVASGTKRQAPGKGPTATATVDLKPGTYIFFCDERGHRGAGMEGKLTVG
jgi:plastocyanin